MIIKTIRAFFLGYLIFALGFGPALADTASLLPPGVLQLFDNNGNPLTSGYVYTYEVGTSTLKTTWKDSAEALPNTNPIRLDAGGKAIVYGNGTYRTVVKDRNGNLIWDAVTAPGGGGGSTPTLVGDGNLVGTVLSWSGLIAPNQYVFAYGQEISRATYSTFFTAITQQLNVICSAASNILTGVADTTQIRVGEHVELALCVPAGTTVVSKTAATITLSNPSNVSINAVGVFFPWGNGNESTTFNVPDFRGVSLVGRTNMGGTASTNLTTVGCPGINPDSLGANCGSQTQVLAQANLPNVTLATTIAAGQGSHTHTSSTGGAFITATAGSGSVDASGANDAGGSILPATLPAMSGTTPTGGSGTAFSIIAPIATVNYIVKVTPDTSTSIATGVWSIGGMSGVIICGTGLLCTGNVISVSAVTGGSNTQIQYNNSNAFAGSPNFTFISPDNLTLGAAGVTGKFDIFGSTSGKVRQVAQAIAGTPTITWGTSSGTPAVTVSAPLALNTTTGNITCTGCLTNTPAALTKVDDTNVTLTLGGTPATALLQAASITAGWTGQLSLTRGGSNANLTASNGGIVYSDASKMQILSGTVTAGQCLLSGSSTAPTWGSCAGGASVTSIAGNTGAFTLGGLLTNSTNVLQVVAAVKSDMQTGTSTTTAVTPAVANQSDSAAKAWAYCTNSAGTYTLAASYNISGGTCGKTGTGLLTLTFTTAFASTNFGCNVTSMNSGLIGSGSAIHTASTQGIDLRTTGGINTDGNFMLTCFGQQ